MKRHEELKTPQGQVAWQLYQLWMKTMKRSAPPVGSFLASKYFTTFYNFVDFIKRVDLPRVESFVRLMVQKNFPPSMWTNNEVYTMYIEYLDHKTTPLEQAMLSAQTLMKYADRNEVSIDHVFDHMPAYEAIRLIQVRKLSPWLLLQSRKFKHMVANANPEHAAMIQSLIRPEFWPNKIKQNIEDVALIKKLVAEMGI